ncbi:MAG: rsmB [Acidobacteria bacterium]|nr:rsmB [Acidobacteriota bacterium]
MSAVAPARREAYGILRAVNRGRADLPAAVARARDRLSDPRDRALAAEIAAGTLRWMGALDAVIAAFARRGTPRFDPEVLEILRLGAYQLLHLQRVPPSAVVSDAVELARASGKRSAAGLVNAVLRRIDRERDALPLPSRPADPSDAKAALDYLAITLSHPRWLAERWLARVGFEAAEAWLRFNNGPAPLTLRANTLATTRDRLAHALAEAGIESEPSRLAPDGLRITHGNPLDTPLARSGAFVVQDEASQLVGALVSAAPGERLLDACAAPGGKSLQMAAGAGPSGVVVAADLRARRVALLAATLRRAGASRVRVVRADAEQPLPLRPVFDAVLLDAPCSGLGTIRRDPEIRWRRQASDLARLAAVQRRMLEAAAAAVKPGGRLVYATCSSEPEENEEVVASFLQDHPEYSEVPPAEAAPGTGLAAAVFDAAGHLRTWPFRHGLEAFFAAVLRRGAA